MLRFGNRECCQQPTNVGWFTPACENFVEQTRHRHAFVDKQTNHATRFCQCQRITEHVHSFVGFAVHRVSDCLHHHHREPFICQSPRLCLLAHGIQHRQCRSGISLGQMDAGLADRKLVGLRQMGGRYEVSDCLTRLRTSRTHRILLP